MPIIPPKDNRGRRENRVPAAPAASRAKLSEAHERNHRGYTGNTRPSLRNGFNGFLRARPGDRALLPPSLHGKIPRNLTPASGRQDHTTSPSASVSFVCANALDAAASTASRSNVRDDRETPLCVGRDGGSSRVDLGRRRSGIFFAEGLDSQMTDLPVRRNYLLDTGLEIASVSFLLLSKNGIALFR